MGELLCISLHNHALIKIRKMDVELSLGEHLVLWSMPGYADLNATIDVTESAVTCVSVVGGSCGSTTPPGVFASDFTVTGYLAEAVADFTSWVESKGGVAAIEGNKAAVFEIKDGYAGIEDLGFTVTKGDVFTVKDYYAGIT